MTNTSDYPLLAGAVNTFLDDTFVAASSLKTVMPGEKRELPLKFSVEYPGATPVTGVE